MDVTEIRESGLLECYVLGQCSLAERTTVEKALKTYPELQNDLYQIGAALEQYARINSVLPSPELKEKLLREVRQSAISDKPVKSLDGGQMRSSFYTLTVSIFVLATLILGYLFLNLSGKNKNLQEEYDRYRFFCDSIQLASDDQFALLNELQDANNQVYPIVSTDKYAETDLYFIYNRVRQQNFIQVRNLPSLNDRQSFQLWSLKAGQAPIPMTVFRGNEGFFIPVEFEEGTATYAITIEPFGGGDTPTLEDLIGTVNIPT